MNDLGHGIADAFWASVFIALFSSLGWILSRGFARMEKRHARAEKKFDDLDDNVADVRYHTQLPPWRSNCPIIIRNQEQYSSLDSES